MQKYTDVLINKLQISFWNLFLEKINSLKDNEKITIWLSGWSSLDSFYEIIKENFEKIENLISL